MTNFGGISTKTKWRGGRGLGYAGVPSALLLNYIQIYLYPYYYIINFFNDIKEEEKVWDDV